MKKQNILFSFAALLSVCSLAACNPESSESDGRTYTYTVNFFDDSDTPQQIGYAYVAEGEKATIHKMNDKDVYDYKSKSTDPIPFGTRNVFDVFEGTYDSTKLNKRGEAVTGPVDLNNIKNDCDVYAKFSNEPLTYKAVFKNGKTVYDDNDNATLTWGTFADLPSINPTTDGEWGYDTSFKGYVFNDANTELVTKENISNAKFLHGAGTPVSSTLYDQNSNVVAAATPGSLYEDTTNMDFYAYSGTWNKVGNFSITNSPKVNYLSKFNHEIRQFTVNFYTDSTLASLIGSLEVDYASTVKFDNENKQIQAICNGVTTTLSFASLSFKPVYWAGQYSNDPEVPDKYRGQSVTNHATSDQSVAIPAGADFWPIA